MKVPSLSDVPRLLVLSALVMVVANGKLWAQTGGTLDPTFGTNGKVTTGFPRQARSNGMVVQPDGKLVLAGTDGSGDFALARYNPDGTLDTSFNGTGKVTTDLNGAADEALAVALQSDGKIVAAGYAQDGSRRLTALIRYNPDGTVDTSFGASGKVISEMPPNTPENTDSQFFAVVVLSDGKILAGGGIHFPPLTATGPERNRTILARYDTSGALDSTFTTTGVADDEFSPSSVSQNVSALAIQTDGKIVASVQAGLVGAVARYSSTWEPDSSFGTGGHVLTGGVHATDVAVQADARIVVTGDKNENFLITRLNSDGTPDSTFGPNGEIQTDFGQTDIATGLVLLADGHIVAGGYSTTPSTGDRDFAIARYNSNGSLDALFGTNGTVLTDFNGTNDINTAIGIQPDGKLLATGTILDLSHSFFGFGLARYLMKEPTTTELSSSLNPAVVGQSITFTANVSSTDGTPAGTVDFRDNGVLIGTATLSGGVATVTTSSLGAGAHPMTAVYTGNPVFLESTSPVGTQTVNQASTVTTLTSSPQPSNLGQVVTFTATITVVPPGTATVTGTVDFFDDTIKLNATPVRIHRGVAEFSTAGLAKGTHRITAVYQGVNNLAGSTSPELRQQVKP